MAFWFSDDSQEEMDWAWGRNSTPMSSELGNKELYTKVQNGIDIAKSKGIYFIYMNFTHPNTKEGFNKALALLKNTELNYSVNDTADIMLWKKDFDIEKYLRDKGYTLWNESPTSLNIVKTDAEGIYIEECSKSKYLEEYDGEIGKAYNKIHNIDSRWCKPSKEVKQYKFYKRNSKIYNTTMYYDFIDYTLQGDYDLYNLFGLSCEDISCLRDYSSFKDMKYLAMNGSKDTINRLISICEKIEPIIKMAGIDYIPAKPMIKSFIRKNNPSACW